MEECLHVAFACDEAYAPFTGVALWSLLEHYRGTTPVRAHILDDAIPEMFRNKLRQLEAHFPPLEISFHPLPEAVRRLPVSPKYPSPTVCARIFLPRIFPKISRMLYLDSDTLVLGEWESLYHLDLGGHAFAARSERGFAPLGRHNRRLRRPRDADYFNVGVLLLDLNRWRSEQLTEQLLALIHARGPFEFPEQDALNIITGGRCCPLPPCWNKFDYRSFYPGCREEMKIIHFVHQKPWKAFSEKLEARLASGEAPFQLPRRWGCYYLTHLFWQAGLRTPFAEEFRALREAAKRVKPMKGPSRLHRLSFLERFFRKTFRDPLRRRFFPPKP